MRGIWTGSLVLALGLYAAGGRADSPQWQPPAAAAVALDRPVALGAPTAAPAPAAALDRPVPAPTPPVFLDAQLLPAAFSSGGFTARAKSADETLPQPMPAGPAQPPSVLRVPEGPTVISDKPKAGGPIASSTPIMVEPGVPGPDVVTPGVPAVEHGPVGGPVHVGDDGACCDRGVCCDGACCGDCCNPCCDTPCCDDGCCGRCPRCQGCGWGAGCVGGQPYRVYGRMEYLLWDIRDSRFPALVTTSPPTSLGVLGRPGTGVLFGGTEDHSFLSGGRFTLGTWFGPEELWGVEGSFFFLGPRSMNFFDSSTGTPLLARPFFNVLTGAEDAQLVANPLIPSLPNVLPLTGSVWIADTTRIWGAEANGMLNLWRDCCCRWDLIGGFRYFSLYEDFAVNENLLVPPNSPMFAGSTFALTDKFDTRNHFYGGQIGTRAEIRWRRWELDVTGKVALGDMRESVNIAGSTVITPAGGAPSTFTGGLLAQGTNIGRYGRDHFAIIPEVGVTVGYQITDHWRAFAGYNVMYVSNVVRAENAIDRQINPSQLPAAGGNGTLTGPARPTFVFRDTDFWAHGATIGLEFRY